MNEPLFRACYPRIDLVPSGVDRPFWSVMIPTYNRVGYLAQALKSVLEQDPGPGEMQIEVVDNGSSDRAAEDLVKDLGKGRVSCFRHCENIGPIAIFNTCIERAVGHWVHILHDDDMLLPWFYSTYKAFIEDHREIGMVFCRTVAIDENDQWLNVMWSPSDRQSDAVYRPEDDWHGRDVVCPSAVVSRNVYERIGGFNPALSYAPDAEMWIRVAAATSAGYIHKPSMLYRYHTCSKGSGTVKRWARGDVAREIRQVEDFRALTFPEERARLTRTERYAPVISFAVRACRLLPVAGYHRPAAKYAFQTLVLVPSLGVVRALVRSFLGACREIIRNRLRRGRPA